MSNSTSDDFELITAMSYHPDTGFHLLALHLNRLLSAHQAIAKEVPGSWCARKPCPTSEVMAAELAKAVEGKDGLQRVRLVVGSDGSARAESFSLTAMPDYPIRLVLDSEPTDYTSLFLRHKTSRRRVYDDARARQGATLHPSPDPSDPPFDVLMFNKAGEVTETTIANVAFRLNPAASEQWVTPAESCGLLPGMARKQMLADGEILERVVTVDELRAAAKAGTLEVICFNAVRGSFKATIAQ